ncbi:hypothetical protein GCM10022267_65410 [Lentzea roselyniae]|uniref:Uncharacterized protein n=1 Tax=Lentzea roselyniae TaxID=531940 RepID=A0ABP7BTY6_9PSEU
MAVWCLPTRAVVARFRAVEADLSKRDTGYVGVPVTAPLTELQIARQVRALNLSLGELWPHVRGRVRE